VAWVIGSGARYVDIDLNRLREPRLGVERDRGHDRLTVADRIGDREDGTAIVARRKIPVAQRDNPLEECVAL
jgi:hypothetical protein